MNIYEKLSVITSELKVPKSHYNSFGGFHSRNIEDIYSVLKPLLKEYKCCLTISNTIEFINGVQYRVSIAELVNAEKPDEVIKTQMFTRETFDHKKMSLEQMSGTTASYGDKYALGKMFLLDDAKDPDEMEPKDSVGQKQNHSVSSSTLSDNQKKYIANLLTGKGFVLSDVCKAALRTYNSAKADKLIKKLNSSDLRDQNEFENYVIGL